MVWIQSGSWPGRSDISGPTCEFLETSNEYFWISSFRNSEQGRWFIYGIDLPDSVLEKLYYKNAEKILYQQSRKSSVDKYQNQGVLASRDGINKSCSDPPLSTENFPAGFPKSTGVSCVSSQTLSGICVRPKAKTVKDEIPVFTLHSVEPTRFEEQLAIFIKNGYQTADADRLYEFIAGTKPIPERTIVLTFDDGWRNLWELYTHYCKNTIPGG